MTASAGAWYRVGKVNVVGGSQSIVGVDTNWQSDVIAIAIGDVFTLDAKTWYEVTAVNSDTSITLDRGFEGSTGTGKSYAILRNTSGTILTRIAGQVSVQFNQKQLFLDELRTWLNSNNATEELTDSHGLKQSLKTPSQMVRDHDNKLAELDAIHPHPWAMRKVEFEARRAANNEKFAASGFVHFGKQYDNGDSNVVNQGLYVNPTSAVNARAQTLHLGRNGVSQTGESKTDTPFLSIAGVVTKLSGADDQYASGAWDRDSLIIKLPPAEGGTRTYDSATGFSVTHATPAIAFASETDTNKVVTDRVDMWGFEAFLREINDADPFVYKNGLIQSLATNINGVTTLTDNVRPDTYFAWHEGDDSSTGKGVNWQTATEAQRTAIASNPDNNIYFDDATGKFYQWCIRGRSFAGAGNGDWTSLESNGSPGQGNALNFEYYSNRKLVYPIGDEDNDVAYTSSLSSSFQSLTYLDYNGNPNSGRGVFSTPDNKVHFLVCGTVNRLNQGAYHPSYNPLGSGSYLADTSSGNMDWYEIDANKHSQLNCFTFIDYDLKTPEDTGKATFHNGSPWGRIGGYSGRPDGRFYDAIYASGQGGVCRDMRYSAWGLTQEDFAAADLAVKLGEYRGRETLKKVVWVGYANNTKSDVAENDIYLDFESTGTDPLPEQISSRLVKGTSGYTPISGEVVTTNGVHRVVGGRINPNLDRVYLKTIPSAKAVPIEIVAVTLSEDLNIPISGEYTHTEVIGDPANILQCDDLKDGWVGSWNPTIPDGTTKFYELTRKWAGGTVTRVQSTDNGASWAQATINIDSVNNTVTPLADSNLIYILSYQTKTKMTEFSENSEIYGGAESVKNVSFYSDSLYSALQYSLINKIPTQRNWLNILENIPFNSFNIFSNKLSLSGSPATHSVINLAPPANNSPAFKALNYNVVENQQGFINYAYTELKYDDAASDWGDDGKIHITDNQATRLDDNGNSVVYGTARIVEPLGWIKNDK